jgi:hypothetical protein
MCICLSLIIIHALPIYYSRDSSVGIVIDYRLDDRGVGVRVKNFLFSTLSRPALGLTQPPIQWVSGDLSPEEKRQ